MSIQGVSSSPCWKYDVFLSFRGEDTRKNFTDHLYAALNRAGINVFRDDKELERGKEISTELLKATEQSRFSIVVFSRNYASSTWCLDELVKIFESKNSRGQKVIPIFYDVDPSTVRKQRGKFQEAFVKHEEVRENTEKVEKWKTALREVANISGWDAKDWHESELVQQIVEKISNALSLSKHRNNITDLIGLDSRLEELKMIIGAGSDDVRMIGICGMGGIGKTTIARAIFESISSEFEGSSFVANVREISVKYDLIYLQKQLLSQILMGININIYTSYDGINMIKDRLQYRKVLIVLDDVVNAEQLNNLAEKCEWFGSGSRIIITTRDVHLLKVHRVNEIYMVEKLNDDEAYQLFSLKAFKDQPPRDFLDLSKSVVQYASGLPLALKVLGCHLCGRNIDEWRSALDRLGQDPENEILDILQISFDGLKESEKKIFLDIACFFKGKKEDYVKKILDGCDFHYDIGIITLIDKCLITLSENKILWMHDLLQELGHQIVIRESPKEPGNRSRLWKEVDIKHVLTKNTGSKAVEAIMLDTELNLRASAKSFLNMTNLRLLKINNVQLPEGLDYLSDQLRLLIWHGYSLKSLPSSVQPDQIVELELHRSLIEQLWKRTTHLKMLMLTSIRLEVCRNLNEIPNLTWAPNLVRLLLSGCPRLLGIHSPLLVLKKLKSLNVHDCTSLVTLPGKIHMESVGHISIFGCPKLKSFPEIAGRMEHLESLHFEGTAIREMPSSVELLIGLERLDLSSNNSLVILPSAINNLKSLASLSLFNCSNLESLPGTIDGLTSLQDLDLSHCSNLVTLPHTINGLASLQRLVLSHCSNFVTLPDTINGLTSLQHLALSLCSNLVTLPTTINCLQSLRTLYLNGCSNLGSLPTTINGLRSLIILDLDSCTKLENVPETLGEVASLRELVLSGTAITQPVSSIFLMKNLIKLKFQGCKGPPSKLSYLHFLSPLIPRKISSPIALMLPAFSDLCSLRKLDLSACNLGEGAIPLEFFSSLLSLETLNLSRNDFLSVPTSVRHLQKLRTLDLRDCKNLQSVPELPSGINELNLSCCVALETLSNALKQCNSQLIILCVNCLKLFRDDHFILPVVKAFLKVVSIQRKKISEVPFTGSSEVIFPGGDIPNWVRHKSCCSSIRIRRPPDFYNNKLVGFILCCVFVVHKILPFLRSSSVLHRWLQCHVKTDEDEVPRSISSNFISRDFKTEHIWLSYLHLEGFKKDKYNHINLLFEVKREPSFKVKGRCGSEVKSCGIHPIYEQDLTDFNPTANQPIVNVATTYGNLREHEDEEPQPKRFKESSSYRQNLSLLKYVRRS